MAYLLLESMKQIGFRLMISRVRIRLVVDIHGRGVSADAPASHSPPDLYTPAAVICKCFTLGAWPTEK